MGSIKIYNVIIYIYMYRSHLNLPSHHNSTSKHLRPSPFAPARTATAHLGFTKGLHQALKDLLGSWQPWTSRRMKIHSWWLVDVKLNISWYRNHIYI